MCAAAMCRHLLSGPLCGGMAVAALEHPRVLLAAARRQRQLRAATAPAAPAAAPQAAAELDQQSQHQLQGLSAEYGISLHPAVAVCRSSRLGRGLFFLGDQQQQHHQQQQQLVSVPLDLVLSCSIAGCSPSQQRQLPPAFLQLLRHPAVAERWELSIAALLLWALRQPRHTRVGGFWRHYAQHLLPQGLHECGSLLAWQPAELVALADAQLQAAATAWQEQVRITYADAGVRACLDSLAVEDDGSQQQPARSSLEEWVWAVAVVESRAFGVEHTVRAAGTTDAAAAPDQQQQQQQQQQLFSISSSSPDAVVGLVPVLDLANHATRGASAGHVVNHTSGTFVLHHQQHQQHQQQQRGSEITITYGAKDSAKLMEQYGFCTPGNPRDRVRFSPRQQLGPGAACISHTAVKAAAARVAQQRRRGGGRLAEEVGQAVAETRLAAAVTSIIIARGWRNAGERAMVSGASTAACARELQVEAEGQLAALHDQPAASNDASLSPGRLVAAAAYRAERRALLTDAVELLREVLLAGSSQQQH